MTPVEISEAEMRVGVAVNWDSVLGVSYHPLGHAGF